MHGFKGRHKFLHTCRGEPGNKAIVLVHVECLEENELMNSVLYQYCRQVNGDNVCPISIYIHAPLRATTVRLLMFQIAIGCTIYSPANMVTIIHHIHCIHVCFHTLLTGSCSPGVCIHSV